uniref:DUF295 domain-containing protein n=1 Tax=Chenopodium quinoa TaxID=63459 RepID=A0A803L892_CHEQI
MSSSRPRHDSWSNLPGPIIHKISKLLKTQDQTLRFKRVCRKWRKCSLPLPVNILSPNLPLSIPISSSSDTPPFHLSNRPLVPQVSSVYLITPSQPSSASIKSWMIKVQESNPGKLRLRHPLTAKRVTKFPSTLNLNRFRVSELAQGYNFKYSDCVHKVLLCSTSPSFVEFLVLYHKGNLGKLTSWHIIYLDDVVEFKKMYCAIDRKGRLYRLDTEAMTVAGVLVTEPICWGGRPTDRRKRLVVDFTSGELYLVLRDQWRAKNSRFTVYKFNEQCKRWDVLESFGNERVIFVGIDHSFFAKTEDFPGCKGNCIVFAANCFTQYSGRDNPDGRLFGYEDDEVGVYRLGRGDNFRLLSSLYPEFSKMIWPPPTWFACQGQGSKCSDDDIESESGSTSQENTDEETSSSIKSLSDGHAEGMLTDSSGESSSDDEKDEEMQLDSPSQSSKADDNSGTAESEEEDEEEIQRSSSSEQCDVQTNLSDEAMKNDLLYVPLLTSEYELNNTGTSKMNNLKNAEDLDSSTPNFQGQDFSTEKVSNNANSTHSTPTLVPLACINCSSTVKFEGVDIKVELLPTLESIWVKHGSLFSEATVSNKRIRACALELLAKLIISLKITKGRSLTDSQADDIKSAMFDLQRVGLKVDWLTPSR